MDKHYGAIVEKVVRRNGHSITNLAILTIVNRRSIYNWFTQARLKPQIILRIGVAINHDFSAEMPELFTSSDFSKELELMNVKSEQPKEDPEELEAINLWKGKYTILIERYNVLLQSASTHKIEYCS